MKARGKNNENNMNNMNTNCGKMGKGKLKKGASFKVPQASGDPNGAMNENRKQHTERLGDWV